MFVSSRPHRVAPHCSSCPPALSPGDQLAVYSELLYPTALHGVSFHPHENMVAFSAFGQSQPVRLYLYDRKGTANILFSDLQLMRRGR